MSALQRMGGYAAIIEAGTFVVGFALYFSVLAAARYGSPEVDALTHVAFLVENQAVMYAWNLVIYVVFGALLVVLSLALHERLKAGAPALSQVATAFGVIWAGLVIASGMVANIGAGVVIDLFARDPEQAATAWVALRFVVGGLGGGNEIVGGLWLLLVSLAGLRSAQLPRALNYLGLVVSSAGLLTVAPLLGELGSIFGLGLIVWFVWTGVVMLRRQDHRNPA